jgi:hypothetical protein
MKNKSFTIALLALLLAAGVPGGGQNSARCIAADGMLY